MAWFPHLFTEYIHEEGYDELDMIESLKYLLSNIRKYFPESWIWDEIKIRYGLNKILHGSYAIKLN